MVAVLVDDDDDDDDDDDSDATVPSRLRRFLRLALSFFCSGDVTLDRFRVSGSDRSSVAVPPRWGVTERDVRCFRCVVGEEADDRGEADVLNEFGDTNAAAAAALGASLRFFFVIVVLTRLEPSTVVDATDEEDMVGFLDRCRFRWADAVETLARVEEDDDGSSSGESIFFCGLLVF